MSEHEHRMGAAVCLIAWAILGSACDPSSTTKAGPGDDAGGADGGGGASSAGMGNSGSSSGGNNGSGNGGSGGDGANGSGGGGNGGGGNGGGGHGGGFADGTYPSDAAVRSAKRGVAAQGSDYPMGMVLTQSDLDVLAPGLSWYYNWSASTDVLDAAGRLEFLPTAWGRSGDQAAVAAWLSGHPGTSMVLSANEPNRGDQANMSAAEAAAYLEATRSIAGGRPVIGPHLAASAQTTAYRNDVDAALTGGLRESCIHIYDGSKGGFDYWATQWPHQGWPSGVTAPTKVWVKEFNYGNATAPEAEIIDFMIHAVDTLERDSRIERYAWWKDRRRHDGTTFRRPPEHFLLSNTTNGRLTALGDIYVNMPVHDPSLWYAIPGRLEAERYVTRSDSAIELQRTADAKARPSDLNGDGRVDITVPRSGWLEYNLDVPTAGAYTVELRASAASSATVELLDGASPLGTITIMAGGYVTTAPTPITLSAGRRTIRLRTTSGSPRLNWLRIRQ